MKTITKKGALLLTLTCIFYALESVTVTVLIYYNAKIIEYAELGNKSDMVRQIIACCVLSVGCYIVTALATALRLIYVNNGVFEMKRKIMKNILRRPLRSFRGQDNAFYFNLMSTDMNLYRTDYLDMLPYLFNSVVAVAASAYMLWTFDLWLLLLGVIAALLQFIIIRPFSNSEQRSKENYSKSSEVHTNVLKENVEGYEVIRSGGGEEAAERRYTETAQQQLKALFRYHFIHGMNFETLLSFAGLAGIACFGVGGYLVLQGRMTVGMLIAAGSYFTSLSNSASNIIDYIVTIRSTKKVIGKLQEQSSIACEQEGNLPASEKAEIRYEGVTFAFGKRVLYRDFNQIFAPNGCYVILGESGSGKSTMMKLLLKYYEGYEGAIFFGEHDIRELSERELYRNIGIVNQSAYLFNASLYDNITMFKGEPRKDSPEYQKILEEMNLTELAKRVLDKPLGDFGDSISGGERQRISIARMLCKKPGVLIFDEPTTGLDPENALLVEEFIFKHNDITRIVISHNWAEEFLNRFDEVIRIAKVTDGVSG